MITKDQLTAQEREYYDAFEPLIRGPDVTDQHFILKTWLRVLSVDYTRTSRSRYYQKQQEEIRHIMERPQSRCTVLCDAAAREYIVGFAVGEEAPQKAAKPIVIHFGFVRMSYRLQGFAKELMKALGWYPGRRILYTQWHNEAKPFLRHFDVDYDPWLLQDIRNPLEENEDGE